MARRCPNCDYPIDDEATACPNCPASWETEEEADYRRRHSPRSRLSDSTGALSLLALAAAALFFGWKALNFVMDWGNSEAKGSPIVRFVASRTTVPQGPSAALPEVPRVLGGAPSSARREAEEPPAQADEADDQAVTTISHEQASAPAARHWRFRGRVWDLTTLSPISRCAVDFVDSASGASYETATDGDGRYRAEVPPLDGHGYSVKIRASGYAQSYLDPGIQGVAGKSAAERAGLAKELSHSLDGAYDVQADSEKPVSTDFYLAPAD